MCNNTRIKYHSYYIKFTNIIFFRISFISLNNVVLVLTLHFTHTLYTQHLHSLQTNYYIMHSQQTYYYYNYTFDSSTDIFGITNRSYGMNGVRLPLLTLIYVSKNIIFITQSMSVFTHSSLHYLYYE